MSISGRQKCPYCGNNPVNHHSTWLSNTLGTLYVSRAERVSPLQRIMAHLTNALVQGLFISLRAIGAARLTTDETKAVSQRGQVLWEEAKRRGIPFYGISLFGKQTDAYCVEICGKKRYFVSLPRPAIGSGSESWLDDKGVLKEKLAAAGIPVPRGGAYTRFSDMARDFERLEKPVIVKPRVGSRGRHTTTHIHTMDDLKKAFDVARQLCRSVVMEEHLVGSVYRGTIIDGELAGVLAGDPPRVVGDGIHTIMELVPIKNSLRHPKVSPVVLDERHGAFLRRTGRNFETVPAAGEVVDLLEKIGVSYGGNSAEVTNRTHPAIKEWLVRAGAVVNDPIIGFDFIIADIAGDPSIQKWGIIECNSTPFINLHHDPVEGEPVNVAAAVWDYVLKGPRRF